jgi:hypothetical protein
MTSRAIAASRFLPTTALRIGSKPVSSRPYLSPCEERYGLTCSAENDAYEHLYILTYGRYCRSASSVLASFRMDVGVVFPKFASQRSRARKTMS